MANRKELIDRLKQDFPQLTFMVHQTVVRSEISPGHSIFIKPSGDHYNIAINYDGKVIYQHYLRYSLVRDKIEQIQLVQYRSELTEKILI